MKTALAALLLAASSAANASDWKVGGVTEGVIVYVDMDSTRKNGDEIRFWSWTISDDPSLRSANNEKSLSVVSCSDRWIRTIQTTLFLDADPQRTNHGPGTKSYLVPDSVEESVLLVVCDLKEPYDSSDDPLKDGMATLKVIRELNGK